mmetsp:Transcript_38844/g.85071  ORF Transcript_38844/g.85071 Transcript_38844/m.85071 type:complete len:252 (+) Transcript_38844:55-810(+)|eukprot:CAMPEP_0170580260 /NCGR_PEP_ID=MMETSP0224-20130122/6416_1 /TAXON_ID=285029 /ORGANISM="Togula jolla, Strain CCCM 725" /LENGTH=251 /DNA_ID=CAMNT_0010903327 /DNA_START=55 /DNA_END=810 /DNA_ORIENTATION=+
MSTGIPADVQQQIMEDPRVQAKIRDQASKMGVDAVAALQDPAVQQQIMDTCKEKFPQYADQASQKIREFVSDPAVQAGAKQALSAAGAALYRGADAFISQIEQGPAGVRILAFIASVASIVNAGLALFDFAAAIFHTPLYVISGYQVIFACTTALFEAKPSWIEKIPGLNRYQNLLLDHAQFLADARGRGMFYFFQGTLWLAFAGLTDFADLATGCFVCFIGILHFAMHYGKLTLVADKFRKGSGALIAQE